MPPEALLLRPRFSDKLDTFSTGVLITKIITRTFLVPTDAQKVMDDPTSPTEEKIIPISELERRKNDINKIPSTHPLLPTIRHCIKDQDRDRPCAVQLCQKLVELKEAPEYSKSKRDNQHEITMLPQTRATLKLRQKEVKELEQQLGKEKRRVQQLAAEHDVEQQFKEREVKELRQ